MNLYEHTIIARQDVSPTQLKQIEDKYSKIVEKFDGNIVKLESVGTALNMKTGMTHPINADGTIDFYEGVACHILYDEPGVPGGFNEDGFELYDLADLEDREVIEEYLETTK